MQPWMQDLFSLWYGDSQNKNILVGNKFFDKLHNTKSSKLKETKKKHVLGRTVVLA